MRYAHEHRQTTCEDEHRCCGLMTACRAMHQPGETAQYSRVSIATQVHCLFLANHPPQHDSHHNQCSINRSLDASISHLVVRDLRPFNRPDPPKRFRQFIDNNYTKIAGSSSIHRSNEFPATLALLPTCAFQMRNQNTCRVTIPLVFRWDAAVVPYDCVL